jgi:ribosomal peptide maturation radical SAM protein 1
MFKEESGAERGDISLEKILEPADVLLVVSPTTGIFQPLLGVHLLQAECRHKGIDTRVLYANLAYSSLIGVDLHKNISRDQHLLLGERIFAYAAFGLPSVSIARWRHRFLDPAWVPDHLWQVLPGVNSQPIPEPVVPFREWLPQVDLENLETLTGQWLGTLARQIAAKGFPIVGCSTTLGGLVPAVALLQAVKRADPRVVTILGGALCETGLVEGIHSLEAGVDYVFYGEGDITFPVVARQILTGRLPEERIIEGRTVDDLDSLQLPDYREYVAQRETFYPHWRSGSNRYVLPFETSRGCRYSQCTFCGFNGKRNVFRRRSAGAIVRDLSWLVERHGINSVYMCDRMMPLEYFTALHPRLATETAGVNIFYHIGADLRLDQVLSLKEAGIRQLQPGIESLSPSLLRRMHKPCTARGNIALLRYARSVGIYLEWLLLFGFPGDRIGEYDEMLRLLPLIRHLQPPRDMAPLVLCRLSRYHMSPQAFGITDLQPAAAVKETLPPQADLERLAYYFSARYPSQSRENPSVIQALWQQYREWRRAWSLYETFPLDILLPCLHLTRKTSHLYVLEDSRGLPARPGRLEVDRHRAGLLLVARPLEAAAAEDVQWAVDAGLAVVMESWLVPLVTADPDLLQEFENLESAGVER